MPIDRTQTLTSFTNLTISMPMPDIRTGWVRRDGHLPGHYCGPGWAKIAYLNQGGTFIAILPLVPGTTSDYGWLADGDRNLDGVPQPERFRFWYTTQPTIIPPDPWVDLVEDYTLDVSVVVGTPLSWTNEKREPLIATTTLRFVEGRRFYTVWQGKDGPVYVARDDGFDSDDVLNNLDTLWAEWTGPTYEFVEAMSELTGSRYLEGEVSFCDDCVKPVSSGYMCGVDHGDKSVCELCYDNYYRCEDCEESFSSTVAINHGDYSVCGRCVGNGDYFFCDGCDTYHHTEDDSCGNGNDGCDCEAPAQVFSIRNDGLEPLANDTPVSVSLPAGVISEEGMDVVKQLILQARFDTRYDDDTGFRVYTHDTETRTKLSDLARTFASAVGDNWVGKTGNFTKRLSRHAYKEHGLKLPNHLISSVGNVASAQSQGTDLTIEVTRDLNLSAEEFGHEESCWFTGGEYGHSRCALKSNGGFGLRSFSDGTYGRSVDGRVWVMPLRAVPGTTDLAPTFDATQAVAFVVFNGYGDLAGYTPARIMAHMAGMTYRKIGFSCSPMYVNNSSGYLVASEEIVTTFDNRTLNLYVDTHADLFHDEQAPTHTKEMSDVPF